MDIKQNYRHSETIAGSNGNQTPMFLNFDRMNGRGTHLNTSEPQKSDKLAVTMLAHSVWTASPKYPEFRPFLQQKTPMVALDSNIHRLDKNCYNAWTSQAFEHPLPISRKIIQPIAYATIPLLSSRLRWGNSLERKGFVVEHRLVHDGPNRCAGCVRMDFSPSCCRGKRSRSRYRPWIL